ncbi:hypothetical protein [Adhaeribacter terreus]|uniref:hypothetical protein n=1 Tax=Adhaeribacter terreus TaxID=529703 RepID=UPI0036709483
MYFITKVDFIDAAINRAYRDFNRTQTGLAEKKKADSYSKFKNLIRTIIEELLNTEFSTQADFDA